MNYKENYNVLINYAKNKNREIGDGNCYEIHHIIPRSLGGKDTKDNLVLLTLREHYLAHFLLWKFSEGENKSKMAYAFYFMSNRDNCKIISSKLYEQAKKEFKKRTSKIKSKKIICLQTLKIYNNAREATKDLNISYKSISRSCIHNISTKGYTFCFYESNKKYIQQKMQKKHFQQNLKIQCVETKEIFNSLQQLSKIINIPRSTISKYIKENKNINGKHYIKLTEGD